MKNINHYAGVLLLGLVFLLLSCGAKEQKIPKIEHEGDRQEVSDGNDGNGIVQVGVDESVNFSGYQHAADFVNNKEYDKAIKEYQQLIEIEDIAQKTNAYQGLGSVYTLLEKYPEAISSLEKCIEIDSRNVYGYIGLGSVYFKMGLFKKAIGYYEQAKLINNSIPESYWGLAVSYYKLRENAKAKENARQFLKMVPDTGYRKMLEQIINQ